MSHMPDDLFLGNLVGPQGFAPLFTAQRNPTSPMGAGPAGRIFFHNIVPLALAAANIAALQAPASGVGLALTAGAGVTLSTAPDGSGAPVILLDVERCVSLTSGANLSAINFLITGYDARMMKMTQLLTGPNIATVHTLKAFLAVQSIVPTGASASTVSAGTTDIFGLPWRINDAGTIISAKWAGVLADNAGTFVVADGTSPATNLTGDTCGTYAQSGAASDGTKRLVIAMHLDATQCGANPTVAALIGVPEA